ncbi:Calpain-B like protein [Argiope bruennichi]|uniref:Calpain-B like protein n=1 Tax=Argiope bruennichi TaxID=94029 RepID=A0A8T0G3X4_ARGBR|nr:Calpain-B like protein [Argiope bruennichi]
MREYDQDIGLTKPDEEVQVQETEEEKSKDQEVKDFFASIAGEDLEVDCYELQEILNFALKKEFTFDGFSLDVCRSMVAMMDVDRSGKLGLEEFKNLWADIRTWKNVFKRYDIDHSGSLNTIELRAALHSAGYRLNFHVLRALVLRYGKKGKINFDDFIMCAVKLKTMIETFQERDPRKTMMASFTLDEVINIFLGYWCDSFAACHESCERSSYGDSSSCSGLESGFRGRHLEMITRCQFYYSIGYNPGHCPVLEKSTDMGQEVSLTI